MNLIGCKYMLKNPIIFPKNENTPKLILGLNPTEYEFDNEKFMLCTIEGLQVDFHENLNFAG